MIATGRAPRTAVANFPDRSRPSSAPRSRRSRYRCGAAQHRRAVPPAVGPDCSPPLLVAPYEIGIDVKPEPGLRVDSYTPWRRPRSGRMTSGVDGWFQPVDIRHAARVIAVRQWICVSLRRVAGRSEHHPRKQRYWPMTLGEPASGTPASGA